MPRRPTRTSRAPPYPTTSWPLSGPTSTRPRPADSTELAVTTDPPAAGETKVIRFTAKGVEKGRWRNCAEMTADTFFGTSTACFSGEVKGHHRSEHDCDDDDHDHHDRHGDKGKRH